MRHQDVLPVRHSCQGDPQPAAGLPVAVGGERAPQHVAHDLHQVEGGMHWSQEALPGLLGHVDDARAGLSCAGGQVFNGRENNFNFGIEVFGIKKSYFLWLCFVIQNVLGNRDRMFLISYGNHLKQKSYAA